jgi:hypothetical protein
MMQVVPALDVQMRKCVAVPVTPAAADVIVLNVNTPPDDTPMGLERGSDTKIVLPSPVATLAGGVPL